MPKNQAMWDRMREEKHAARDQMIEKLRQRKTFKGKAQLLIDVQITLL